MEFKLWSELNPEAKKELKLDFGIRSWNLLDTEEKEKIWKHLEYPYFFRTKDSLGRTYFDFYDSDKSYENGVGGSIFLLNKKYKAEIYAPNFFNDSKISSACIDFYTIFIKEDENLVFELLSLYCSVLINDDGNTENESEDQQKKWIVFDEFAKDLNDVFTSFGINVILTRQGFIPRQEEKIDKEIYVPVLNFLSHTKWEEVSKLFSESFDEYRRHTSSGYSNSITNTISAVQAFLQIEVYGKTGKGNIKQLIAEGQKKQVLPDDSFTRKILNFLESIFAEERQEKGIAHPKKEYATEKSARTLMNLSMIFLQHCIQN